MDEMELMMHLHRNNKRQGPGSEDATNLAVTLAKMLKGNIIAVDLFEEFLE